MSNNNVWLKLTEKFALSYQIIISVHAFKFTGQKVVHFRLIRLCWHIQKVRKIRIQYWKTACKFSKNKKREISSHSKKFLVNFLLLMINNFQTENKIVFSNQLNFFTEKTLKPLNWLLYLHFSIIICLTW